MSRKRTTGPMPPPARYAVFPGHRSTTAHLARALPLLASAGLFWALSGWPPTVPACARLRHPASCTAPAGSLDLDGPSREAIGFEGSPEPCRRWVPLDGERRPTHGPGEWPRSSLSRTWSALPHQGFLDGQVLALAAAGNDLFVAGLFDQTVDGTLTHLGHIARYDTVANAWHALPDRGLSAAVYALAVSGDDLYVGGAFTMTGDGALTDLNSIARYSMSTDSWHALPNRGLTKDYTSQFAVHALVVSGSQLYAGGLFTHTGDGTLTDLGNVARFDVSSATWHALPARGLDHVVQALAARGSDLYVGGRFTRTGDGTLSDLGHMARYDGSWHALPARGLAAASYGAVNALAVQGGDLYVGGAFTQTGNGATAGLSNIARYDPSAGTWHALPDQGLSGPVFALAADGGDLYVGGEFAETGDRSLSDLGHIAVRDGASGAWRPLPNRGLGVGGAGAFRVEALAVQGTDLYVGGGFTHTGDGLVTGLGGIARFGAPHPSGHGAYLPVVTQR